MNIKDQIIKKISSFPTLPAMANRLLSLLNDPDISASDIGRAIQFDPALTANLLKAANSVYLGQSRKVDSISEAFFRLGTKWVFQMSISSLIYSNLRRPVTGYGLSGEDLWRHSIAVAQMSDLLCQHLNIRQIGLAFTAGLLHDMGKIILGEFVSGSFDEIRMLVQEEKVTFEKAEEMIIGMDHAEVGSLTAQSWNFPQTIVECIRWHHQPDMAETVSETIDIVHVADATCLMQGIGIGRDDINYRLNVDSINRLNVSGRILETAASQLITALDDFEFIVSEKPDVEKVGKV